MWNQFDFGSRRRDDTKPNLNKKGLYFFDRRAKDVAFYYRARLAPEPVLHVAARDWPRRAGSSPADARDSILVYSNLDQVELRQDSTSLGVRRIVNSAARWDVMLHPGINVLVARGRHDTQWIEDRCDVFYEDRGPAGSAAPALLHAGDERLGVPVLGFDRHRLGSLPRLHARRLGTRGRRAGNEPPSHLRLLGRRPVPDESRGDPRSCASTVPAGAYEVELRFAETRASNPVSESSGSR